MAGSEAFSQWAVRGTTQAEDTVVGLSGGKNTQFSIPALRAGLATNSDVEKKLDKDGKIEEGQVNGLTQKLQEMGEADVAVERIPELSDTVQNIVDATPNIVNSVEEGPHEW